MNKMENTLILRKLPIIDFIKVLTELYESGVDYFDLEGKSDVGNYQDVIKLTYTQDYLSQEALELELEGEAEEHKEEQKGAKIITTEDFENLI